MKKRDIDVGDAVYVPDPLSKADAWKNSFYGRVHKIEGAVAIVIDQDDNAFQVERSRLEQ